MMTDRLIYLLYPFSLLYACVSFVRNLFFDVGIFRQKKLPVPVISVGNITTGGTGKTPAVAYIAGKLQSEGKKVGILSRGYKRSTRGYVAVADGERVLVGAESGGDEPVLLAHTVRGAVVAVDEKRARGGKLMTDDFGIDVIVVDDGFQHRSLYRNLDIVLINASRTDHLRAHLPVGRLRENLYSLRRADVVIITKCNDDELYASMEKLVNRYTSAPVLRSKTEPQTLVDVVHNIEVPMQDVLSKKAYLFCGIADPDQFRETVHAAGITILGEHRFTDHYRYTEKDINALLGKAETSGADILLTTEKDAIRIHAYKYLFTGRLPFYAIRVSFSLTGNDVGVFVRYVNQILKKNKRSVTIH